MSSASSGNANGGTKYFLYIPVWATTQEPGGGSDDSGSSGATDSSASATSELSSDESGATAGSGSGTLGSSGASGGSSGGGTGSDGTGPGGTGPGGTGPGGTGPGGTGPGGTGPGGTPPSGTGGSSNCLLHGTLVTMADGRRVPIELLAPGDEVASLVVPGLKTDMPFKAQYQWMSTWGLAGATVKPARIATVTLGEHDGFVLINGRLKATPEHPFLIRRTSDDQDAWGFCSAEFLRVGDRLVVPGAAGTELGEEPISVLDRIDGRVKTVAIHVPGTNTYLADGVWTHNDSGPMLTVLSSTSASESSVSSSGSGKSSGSSFSSSSGSALPTQASTGGG